MFPSFNRAMMITWMMIMMTMMITMNDDDTIGENIEACEARQWKNGDSDAIWIMAPSHRTTSLE